MTTYEQGLQDCLDAINSRLNLGPISGFDGVSIRTGMIIATNIINELIKGGYKDGTNKENTNKVEEGSTKGKR